jgi:hypothetical protein
MYVSPPIPSGFLNKLSFVALSLAKENREVWLAIREGTGEDLGVMGRRIRMSSEMRPSWMVTSREVLGRRGGSKEVGEGTWWGK